jgi:hypothetical protein
MYYMLKTTSARTLPRGKSVGQSHQENLFYDFKEMLQNHKPSVIARSIAGGFPAMGRSNLPHS